MKRPVFLDWNRPPLHSAAEYLLERYRNGSKLDMGNVVIALPGGRSGRRLEELILREIEKKNIDPDWYPPCVMTLGKLPEKLYRLKFPLASDIEQQFVWIKALDQMQKDEPDTLSRFIQRVPDPDELEERLALGKILSMLHRELAAEGLDFSDVHEKMRERFIVDETHRWKTLHKLQLKYHRILDGLKLWDVQSARVYAVNNNENHEEIPSEIDFDIVLVGTVDLNAIQKEMLKVVNERVTSLVFAPESLSEMFCEFGTLITDKWTNAKIDIPEAMLNVVDRPGDEATAVMLRINDLDGRCSGNQITIGVPGEEVIPFLEQRMQQCGIKARYGPGASPKPTAVYRFIESITNLLKYRTFSCFSELIRHPAFQMYLSGKLECEFLGDCLSESDKYHETFLPDTLEISWRKIENELDPKHSKEFTSLEKIAEEIRNLLGDAWVDSVDGKRTPLSQQGETLRRIVDDVFGKSRYPSDVSLLRSLENVLKTIEDIPDEIVSSVLPHEAFRLFLGRLDSARAVPPQDTEAIEMLGWLELPMDDAEQMIVTGMNEGLVPSSKSSDLFLPNEIRTILGIEDNDRRLARDMYALSLLVAQRKSNDSLRLFVRRRSTGRDPMVPSRLFFACDANTIAKRIQLFFQAPENDVSTIFTGDAEAGRTKNSDFRVPTPKRLEAAVKSMRVTEFRAYLACPYRYYLRHRLSLDVMRDDSRELGAAQFGTLAHDVLQRFGLGDLKDSTDPDAISNWLNSELNNIVRKYFGDYPPPVVSIQVEQLRLRLNAFSVWQADWARTGNRIEYVEFYPDVPENAFIKVDGEKMFLRGRIDRIDHNSETGKWTIFDYKTTDTPKTPEKVHCEKGEWTDLQLPLYRYIVRNSIPGIGLNEPDLGYISLPKDAKASKALIADWGGDDLSSADAAASEVVRAIRDENFWPPVSPPPIFSEIYAPICLDESFSL